MSATLDACIAQQCGDHDCCNRTRQCDNFCNVDMDECLPQEMIDEADRDGDGEVNEEEFFRIMKKTSLF